MSNSMRVAIVGGGLVGRILAVTLLESFADIRLDLYDKSTDFSGKSSCGYAAAGMVAPVSEALDEGQMIYDLSCSAAEAWQRIDRWLLGGVFTQTGTNIIAHPLDLSDLETKIVRVQRLSLHEHAYAQTSLIDQYNQGKLAHRMLHIENEGCVHVPQFFSQSTLYLMNHPRVSLHLAQDISKARLQDLQRDYDYVCDTRGIGAKDSFNDLYGIRGEALVVYAPEVNITGVTRLCHPRMPLYIVPRGSGFYYIGATIVQSEDMSQMSVISQLTLLSALLTVDEGFAEARIIKNFTQVRPCFKEGLPRLMQQNNLITLNGFYRHGYLLAPIYALKVIDKMRSDIKDIKIVEQA
ncbi:MULTISPECIES: FAD-dependent oxidoreductase [Cysteiniphilum]|uniref:D-amino-acid oxidase n=1 Tax=Cysteiniphilum litorale TaxID=2056700 RepID=A0A8J2Z6M7_9GAMM|nr:MULTISPECIES: FAD-dependent oxidoreductase [Cysteiniphilum]GGG05712.1 glycine oxidase ThiO [Cysteiniphilum litorale]